MREGSTATMFGFAWQLELSTLPATLKTLNTRLQDSAALFGGCERSAFDQGCLSRQEWNPEAQLAIGPRPRHKFERSSLPRHLLSLPGYHRRHCTRCSLFGLWFPAVPRPQAWAASSQRSQLTHSADQMTQACASRQPGVPLCHPAAAPLRQAQSLQRPGEKSRVMIYTVCMQLLQHVYGITTDQGNTRDASCREMHILKPSNPAFLRRPPGASWVWLTMHDPTPRFLNQPGTLKTLQPKAVFLNTPTRRCTKLKTTRLVWPEALIVTSTWQVGSAALRLRTSERFVGACDFRGLRRFGNSRRQSCA